MATITYDSTYFNPTDVLDCGQIFRYEKFEKGYKVFTKDKACYIYSDGKTTFIESDDDDYFYNFFDLDRDYGAIIKRAKEFNLPFLSHSCEVAKGLRLLNQDPEEMIFSFIVSQNNNIPRIKKILFRLCEELGEEKEYAYGKYYTFPKAEVLSNKSPEFFKSLGAGYRDKFIYDTAKRLCIEGVEHLKGLDTLALRKQLLTFKGIGEKVADCICLFAFKKTDSFPVDTWIEKLYHDNFAGELTDRSKINAYFLNLFKEYSAYVQQYLFYAKRENL